MPNTLYPQLQTFSLYSSGATIGDVTVVLSEFKDIDGVLLTMADFGPKGFMTLNPGSGIIEEQISFSGVTQNANGTATLTGVKTVLCKSPYTETSGLVKEHSGGSTAVVAITSGLLNQFANKGNDETITGTYTIPTHTSSDIHQPSSIEYVNSVALAGTVNASETVKGIVELATVAEQAAGTSSGSTGARLSVAASACKSTSAGAGDANKVPVLGADGLLDQTFLDKARTWGLVQSLTAANVQITSDASAANDAIRLSFMRIDAQRGLASGTSGEAFAIGDALYLKALDSKLYKAQGTVDERTFSFVGIAQEAAGAADQTKLFSRPGGIATGLTGLTAGAYYYITDTAGTIGTTPGTRFAKIGQALSTTTLRVCEPKFVSKGVVTITGTGNTVITCGFYPAEITILAALSNDGGVDPVNNGGLSIGSDSNQCIFYGNDGSNYETGRDDSNAVRVELAEATGTKCTVSAKTQTTFTINCSNFSLGTGDLKIHWTAFSE